MVTCPVCNGSGNDDEISDDENHYDCLLCEGRCKVTPAEAKAHTLAMRDLADEMDSGFECFDTESDLLNGFPH
jgi:hypothetical protein